MFKVPQLPPTITQSANPIDQRPLGTSTLAVQDDIKIESDISHIPLQPSTKLIICLHTKDVSDEDIKLFQKFGRTRNMNSSMINIELSKLDCEYLFVDVRQKAFRNAISKVNLDDFGIFGYVNLWEAHDNLFQDLDPDINVLTKFSHSQKFAFKHEFDDYLLCKCKIRSPSTCLSLMAFLVNVVDSLKKK